MHVSGLLRAPLDLNLFLQFIFTALIFSVGLLYLVKNTASKYFIVDGNFDSSSTNSLGNNSNNNSLPSESKMPGFIVSNECIICSNSTTKQCSGCKMVRYCSEACQRSHWNSGHKKTCKKFLLSGKANSMQSGSVLQGRKLCTAVPLISASGSSKSFNESKEILFPYDEFVQLFYWEKPGFPPCGLLNCGNSCFANVVLQCLGCTRPLVAYFLEKGHQSECRRNDWCFMCEFQRHVERATRIVQPFSPINILSRLPNIGGNFGYGKQEDAHEFIRFAIDTMQSVCLDEFGGEKAVHPRAQETTFIQHIFGGHLQSQVICTKCNNVSNQFENMMDLTVEIQGDVASLEECLDQFTVKERLHGDNMYKCDKCNDYVLAWKRLTIRQPPNILTIALKRFQSGRFGKLNKRVSFPETLDLSPYTSEVGDDGDVYKLYAVVVHVDMLNASYFGHYICYTKDFSGNWYRIDDYKVNRVELEEVLSQGAYMLLYSRVCVRPSCSNPMEPARKHVEEKLEVAQVVLPCAKQTVENSAAESIDITAVSGQTGPLLSDTISQAIISGCEEEPSSVTDVKENLHMVNLVVGSSVSNDVESQGSGCSNAAEVSVSDLEIPHSPVFEASALTITEPYVLEVEPPIPVFNVESKNGDIGSSVDECVIMDSQVSSTWPCKNGVCENGEAFHDGSVAILSTGQVLDEAYPFSSSGNAEKVEPVNGLPSSLSTDYAAGKKDGREFSGSKSKPLFPPGFLGKRPREKNSDQEEKIAAEIGELASACNLNCLSNGFTKHDLSHPNEGDIGDQEHHFPSDFWEKQTVNSKSEDQMVASQSSESDIPYNGGSSTPSGSCESFDIENDRSLVEEQIPLHVGSVISLSTGEVLDEAHPFTSNGKPEKVESGKGLKSSHGTDDVEGKNGEIKFSESKLKPIFPPGFLGKRPREKYSNKQEAKALEDTGELATAW